MDFFYPNWMNDFWRIQGLIHFDNKSYFEDIEKKAFNKKRIVEFCQRKRFALFDTAKKDCRIKDNADDHFLDVLESTNIDALLAMIPACQTIVTTGGKASEEIQA